MSKKDILVSVAVNGKGSVVVVEKLLQDKDKTRKVNRNTVKLGYNEQLGTGHFCSL
jgi:hypothetical protein